MKANNKDNIREIRVNFKRFISLLLMAFLGVGFYVGIKSSSPSMLETANTFYKNQNMYDIEVVSTLGLTSEDLDAIKSLSGVKEALPVYTKDTLIHHEQDEYTIKIYSASDINVPYMLEGEMPQKGQIIVESEFLKTNNLSIGDKVTIDQVMQQNDEGEEIPYFKTTEFEIVGTMLSPLYLEHHKGTSTLGTGSLDYVGYINVEDIENLDIISQIEITVKGADEVVTNSKQYKKEIENVKDEIENIKVERQNARFEQLKEKANDKVDSAEKELQDKQNELNETIETYQKEIEDNLETVNAGLDKLQQQKQTITYEFKKAQAQIDSSNLQLQNAKTQLSTNIENASKTINELNAKKDELYQQYSQLQVSRVELENAIPQLKLQIQSLEQAEQTPENVEMIQNLTTQLQSLEENYNNVVSAQDQLSGGIDEINSTIVGINTSLNTARLEIETNEAKLKDSQEELNTNKKTAFEQIAVNTEKLENAKAKIAESQIELDNKKAEFETQINEAKEKLIDAREKIDEIKSPKWYIFDRTNNQSYLSLMQDVDSIENLAHVFPILFFLIAILISLNAMTRMVEEQRTTIGTYKALGYSNFMISMKYIIYSTIATIVGGVFGSVVGIAIIPTVIWSMYQIMYKLPGFAIHYELWIVLAGIGILFICIVGATLLTLKNILKENSASLMRPKPPKNGKRVFLENIKPLWNHLSFNSKVTVRNLFRYKKRFLMTIIGICGCTSLIITGYGLRDSISALAYNQYGNIFNYDLQVVLKSNLSVEQITEVEEKLLENANIDSVYTSQILSSNVSNPADDTQNQDLQIVVVDDKQNFGKFISLTDEKTDETIDIPEDGIVLTEKVAQLIGIKKGDEVNVKVNDNTVKLKVVEIAHNYISHYVYISKELFEQQFEKYDPNIVYVKEIQDDGLDSKEEQEKISEQIMQIPQVSTVNLNKTILDNLDKTLSSLNTVVYILIISAGLLAFVVLYNLASVNISERQREIATIKVLGFYDGEVFNYITQETVILTILGIILGLAGGYFLTSFILKTCEINSLRFAKVVTPLSYVISSGITIIFTVLVNIMTNFSLKKIDMIDSLKSVE